MNLYGFVGGDPVNFADPFGLCGKKGEDPCPSTLIGAAVRLGQMAPATNEAVASFLPNNLAAAAVGGAVGKAFGALFARARTVAVTHFTSTQGAAAIESSGGLNAGSFVALPSEVAGRSAAAVESLLEIAPGRGAMSATFRVSADVLRTPINGPVTSGGATQFQTTKLIPLPPGAFKPVPE